MSFIADNEPELSPTYTLSDVIACLHIYNSSLNPKRQQLQIVKQNLHRLADELSNSPDLQLRVSICTKKVTSVDDNLYNLYLNICENVCII